ncbi:release factor glutamine methyltransferase [Microbacterium endophyticum]|uniref:Release factor glutamine methyltransferase n=1 Tax=Microbacterium endophyticum TaxID=1526412 RepID=A0A7W4YMH7_9MICO|nr:peptide chain release factor N(5)-glutamine methyltransferase [Microbacterium endophyticum]MBB2976223.1 release factor glutamine methyltransferase [Microbacterium endophyticum]NIK35103.1 release factor glutamine methyltransferase [Microbacterium endophyticum]
MTDSPDTPPLSFSLAAIVRGASETLQNAGVTDPQVDAELLAAHVLETSRGGLQSAMIRGVDIDSARRALFADAIERRARREPLQHITGVAPFRQVELAVGPGVFVPRPETELLAQIAIDGLQSSASPAPIGVDLGTGSGAVAISMATEVPHSRVFAAENSVDAFIWARQNAARLAGDNLRLAFIDLENAFPELDGTVSVVASNPPYVPDGAIPRDAEVRRYDPPQALYGGPDGLDVVRILSAVGMRLAHPGGMIAIEHGEWQGPEVRSILADAGWRATATHPDLTLRDRVTTGLRP